MSDARVCVGMLGWQTTRVVVCEAVCSAVVSSGLARGCSQVVLCCAVQGQLAADGGA